MNTLADKSQENTASVHQRKSQSVAIDVFQKKSSAKSTFQFIDLRPEGIAQRKLQEMANNSAQVSHLRAFQEMANNSPQAKQATQFQAMADKHSIQQQPPEVSGETIQKKESNTGLPENLKTGLENLSGYSMDNVKVHRNSVKPAQLNAHAYAQGTDIHLGPGQEKHLPHEAWHVVQQKQDRVKPTKQLKGMVSINDDAGLEKEADVIGGKVSKLKVHNINTTNNVLQAKSPKEWFQEQKAKYQSWRARRRNQLVQSSQDLSVQEHEEIENDSSDMLPSNQEYSQQKELSEEFFEKDDILTHTKITNENERYDRIKELGLTNEPMKKIESFPESVTGDNIFTGMEKRLNFENLYGKKTWVMKNNFRDPDRTNFHASDVVDVQARMAGLEENYIPDQIVRSNIVNKEAIKYLEGRTELLNKEFTSDDKEFDDLMSIKNIKSTGNILKSRNAEIESILIKPLQGNQYLIVIKPKRKES